MKKVAPDGMTIRGIDLYHGDMISDADLLSKNIKFAFLKAFEYSEDSLFKSRWASLKTHGVTRGAYDFFHPSKDPIEQANKFLSIVGPLNDDDLPCALDWESTDGTPTAKDSASAMKWLLQVEKVTGKTPIIYAAPYFAEDLKLSADFKRFPLWVAHYGVNQPLVPDPWTKWAFWQNSETGNVPGIKGHCDTDIFNGTVSDLQAFIKGSKLKPVDAPSKS